MTVAYGNLLVAGLYGFPPPPSRGQALRGKDDRMERLRANGEVNLPTDFAQVLESSPGLSVLS